MNISRACYLLCLPPDFGTSSPNELFAEAEIVREEHKTCLVYARNAPAYAKDAISNLAAALLGLAEDLEAHKQRIEEKAKEVI